MDVTVIASIFSSSVTLVGLLVLLRGQNRIKGNMAQGQWDAAVAVAQVDTKVGDVAAEVATTNGIPQGQLAERAEGRRIEQIPVEKRTTSEQEYVTKLHAGGRNLGHDGPDDRTMGPEGGLPKTQEERDAL